MNTKQASVLSRALEARCAEIKYEVNVANGLESSSMKAYKVRDKLTGKYFNGFREGASQKDHQVFIYLNDFGRIYDKPNTPKSVVTKMMRVFENESEKMLFCKYDLEVVTFELVEVKNVQHIGDTDDNVEGRSS